MAFNPLQNFLQGQQFGQGQKVNRLAGEVSDMTAGGAPLKSNPSFQELLAIDPDRANKISSAFANLSKERKQAFYEDMVTAQSMLGSGDVAGTLKFLKEDRGEAIKSFGGDSFTNDNIITDIENMQPEKALDSLNKIIAAGEKMKYLSETKSDSNKVQSSKILDDGTIIQVMSGGGRQVLGSDGQLLKGDSARKAVAASNRATQERKIELKKLDQTIKQELKDSGLLDAQQTAIQANNIKRIGALSNEASTRASQIKKATKFKLALESGEAKSGATRSAASFIPGSFTSQAEFDAEFNSFVEFAARSALKASGELRPTAEDVEGAKSAFFGIGRDEATNIQLLSDFIGTLKDETAELDQLIEASKSGNLSSFTFTSPKKSTPALDPSLTLEELKRRLADLEGKP